MSINVGDRVRWRSRRADCKGNRYRIGTVLKIQTWIYALVKPDKGQGRRQYIVLGRLRKVEVLP